MAECYTNFTREFKAHVTKVRENEMKREYKIRKTSDIDGFDTNFGALLRGVLLGVIITYVTGALILGLVAFLLGATGLPAFKKQK